MRNFARRYLPPLLIVLGSAISAPVVAQQPPLVARRLLLGPSVSTEPATGAGEDSKILRLARISEKRFLALIEECRVRMDPWADRRRMEEERRQRGVVSGGIKDAQCHLTLAILDADGKVLQRAAGEPELGAEVSPFPGSHSLPLVMERSDRCPYAMLHAASRRLVCFDAELGFRDTHDIPLDEIGRPRVGLIGDAPTLWIFGRSYAAPPKVASFADAYELAPQLPRALGFRYLVDEASWQPIPVEPQRLATDLARVVRGPKGETVSLLPASIRLTPFTDRDDTAEFEVLIEAVSAERYDSPVRFAGTRHYARARLSPEGLGAIEPLSLFLIQEQRPDMEFRLEGGTAVVRLPPFAKTSDLQVFGLGERRFAVLADVAFKVPGKDGGYDPDRWSASQLLVLVSGTQVEKVLQLDDVDLLATAAEPLMTGDRWVSPIKLVDRVGKDEYAFWALCGSRQRRAERQRCLVTMSVRE